MRLAIRFYRIDLWHSDRLANPGDRYTVVEVYRDGSEQDVFTTSDKSAAEVYAAALAMRLNASRDLDCDDQPIGRAIHDACAL